MPLDINSSQCKDINYSKEKGKKTIDIAKKKDTGCEFKNSDIPPATCNLIEQKCNIYRGVADINADSVEKFRISKAHKIHANPKKDISTKIPKKKSLHHCKKVIVLDNSSCSGTRNHIFSRTVAIKRTSNFTPVRQQKT